MRRAPDPQNQSLQLCISAEIFTDTFELGEVLVDKFRPRFGDVPPPCGVFIGVAWYSVLAELSASDETEGQISDMLHVGVWPEKEFDKRVSCLFCISQSVMLVYNRRLTL